MGFRVSLLVTETVDAGLFGERLMQTLLHAWKNLLLPPLPPASLVPPVPCIICRESDASLTTRRNGIVVPFGASLWFAAVECPSVALRYRFNSYERTSCSKVKVPFTLLAELDEPYDCENLKHIYNSYKFLCEPVNCFYVNFNDMNELQDFYSGVYDERIISVKCSVDGSLDCFAFWFDLHLDEDIKLSSSPLSNDEHSETCSWDQAVFPVKNKFLVSSNSSINIKVKTKNGKLGVKIVDLDNYSFPLPADEMLIVSQEVVRFMNNSAVITSFYSVANLIKNKYDLLDFSPFPLLNFYFLSDNTNSVHVVKTESEISVFKKIAVANELPYNSYSFLLESSIERLFNMEYGMFDVIVTNLIDSSGELKESSIAQLPKLR